MLQICRCCCCCVYCTENGGTGHGTKSNLDSYRQLIEILKAREKQQSIFKPVMVTKRGLVAKPTTRRTATGEWSKIASCHELKWTVSLFQSLKERDGLQIFLTPYLRKFWRCYQSIVYKHFLLAGYKRRKTKTNYYITWLQNSKS